MKFIQKAIVYLLIILLPSCYSHSLISANEFNYDEYKDNVKKIKLKDEREFDFSNDPAGFTRFTDKGVFIKADSSGKQFVKYDEIRSYQIEKIDVLNTSLLTTGCIVGGFILYAILTLSNLKIQ